MGKRKRNMANAIKEAKKNTYFASLRNIPSSPRKMRYVVDLVRGMEVNKALATLHFNTKSAAQDVEKLLRSAIANWEQKNERKAENGELYISKIFVDEGATLKRMRPAPQGRGYRIRKRSNHVTIFVDAKPKEEK
ncbi:MAG: 50S ribosomal protein L22 [Bacteroidaceae bacterium]|jgi:large subunit ribosomal protein L22|nr:50S ribosomal protein L22 [Bacteroidaceae bacterium]MBQ2166200.1 50S ribosomal protein L22 [Bacteroidaceae bacterium]MBQ2182026.1 50S ribosomal protein L22 [Bacteroidaceae bacterium]MBQ2200305.1 50S ribosomal protein L22 [Bacteroidaceae bacterium]MBQ2339526.1 50S ribosomal protein L22 [Bacteroidaceae bacterium]